MNSIVAETEVDNKGLFRTLGAELTGMLALVIWVFAAERAPDIVLTAHIAVEIAFGSAVNTGFVGRVVELGGFVAESTVFWKAHKD